VIVETPPTPLEPRTQPTVGYRGGNLASPLLRRPAQMYVVIFCPTAGPATDQALFMSEVAANESRVNGGPAWLACSLINDFLESQQGPSIARGG
jgi:hypothetical protein